jgi:hypothetical protein
MKCFAIAIAVAATVFISIAPIQSDAAHLGSGRRHGDARGDKLARSFGGDGFVSNGSFDWRHRRYGRAVPWYAYGYRDNCLAWTPHAYHYACDPSSHY